jgi:hypothetical protein
METDRASLTRKEIERGLRQLGLCRAGVTLYENLRHSDPYGIFGLARPDECLPGCGTSC